MSAVYLWLIVAAVTLIAELFSPAFVFICFTGGALVAALSTIWIGDLAYQALVFAIVSVVLIPLTRPLARRMSLKGAARSNVDALVGRKAYVLEAVDESQNTGKVRIGGEEWRAVAETYLPVKAEVVVTGVEGATLIVARPSATQTRTNDAE
jgi:membrane protein implicated in regulation of membrane protease activity